MRDKEKIVEKPVYKDNIIENIVRVPNEVIEYNKVV